MNMDEVFAELDRLYDNEHGEGVEEFLLAKVTQALGNMETGALIQLLNELIGYYREHSEHEKCVAYCVRLQNIIEGSELAGTMAHATTLLNIATCYRAAGLLKESNALYQQVKAYYDANLSPDSMLFASLYNNMSLLFREMGDFESAADCLERALGISLIYPECRIEQATTYANLASTFLQLGRGEEAEDLLTKSIELFERDSVPDYHYSAALSAMAEAKYGKGDYRSAVNYYEKSLKQIERSVGKNQAYEITLQNLKAAKSKITIIQGIELSEKYYEAFGKEMIADKFPEYEKRIAVGIVGEGSECYGFDDETSKDHDFGPGFCMWLTDEDYEKIGEKLQSEYDELPKEFEEIIRIDSGKADKRTGVFRISDFYKKHLGIIGEPKELTDWLYINDEQFAVASNGKVFRDDLGEFTRIREVIGNYYPFEARKRKIARSAALMSQYGQYNYRRMLDREDKLTAFTILGKFVEEALQMVYLLNKKYAPFYKWKRKGVEELPILENVKTDLDFIATLPVGDGRIQGIIDKICTDVLDEMVKQGFAKSGDNYLDNHTAEIMSATEALSSDMDLVDMIVKLEWQAFDKVKNEGGRAFCQDDWPTFSIMRKSQYMTWTGEMLRSFIDDFNEANGNGWNIITEKYGRMEESTAPEEYAKIKDKLPIVDDECRALVEAIVSIQVGMMEEFAKEYPKAACQARSIHTSEDSAFNTSYETYLRGELLTYSDRTLELYGKFVADCAKKGENIARMTMLNTARMYGYETLDELESKLY